MLGILNLRDTVVKGLNSRVDFLEKLEHDGILCCARAGLDG